MISANSGFKSGKYSFSLEYIFERSWGVKKGKGSRKIREQFSQATTFTSEMSGLVNCEKILSIILGSPTVFF